MEEFRSRAAYVGAVAALAACGLLTGCIAVGYSSSGGWFLWPGGIGLLIVLVVVILLLRR